MSKVNHNTLTQEQKQELRDLTLTEFFNLADKATVQKSLLTAFRGFLENVQGEDEAYSHSVDQIGEDIFMVCALLDYLKKPGRRDQSLFDLRGVLHYLPTSPLKEELLAKSRHV